MDRLTERVIAFDGTSCIQIRDCSNNLCSEICERQKAGCEGCPIETALERLAQYEDIGLTPDQLLVVDKMYEDRCREIAELKKTFTGNCDGCKNNDTDECMHCMRAYSDCYEAWVNGLRRERKYGSIREIT